MSAQREKVVEQGDRSGQKEGFYTELALVATENLRASHVLRAYTRERIYKVRLCAGVGPGIQADMERYAD